MVDAEVTVTGGGLTDAEVAVTGAAVFGFRRNGGVLYTAYPTMIINATAPTTTPAMANTESDESESPSNPSVPGIPGGVSASTYETLVAVLHVTIRVRLSDVPRTLRWYASCTPIDKTDVAPLL